MIKIISILTKINQINYIKIKKFKIQIKDIINKF